jgi:hypothetical protein
MPDDLLEGEGRSAVMAGVNHVDGDRRALSDRATLTRRSTDHRNAAGDPSIV